MVQLKSLHICNIANVAYGYCKILNASGHEVRLLCHDINHLMSQPEWDDQDLDFNNFPDENNFFLSHQPVELTRPSWYQRVDIQHFLDVSRPGARKNYLLHVGEFGVKRLVRLLSKYAPISLKEALRPYFYKIFYSKEMLDLVKPGAVSKLGSEPVNDYEEDALKFAPHVEWLKRLTNDEEVIFAYVLSPIYTMFKHDRPVVAVEIGTMRDIPFEDTANGRMLTAAYRAVDHVIITNPDVKAQADEIGITSYSFCPHPVDEERYKPIQDSDYCKSTRDSIPDTEWLGVAPARQNWEIKGNYKYIEALKQLREEHGKKVSLVIPAWGQDIQRSKSYAEQLGVDKYIKWIPPVAESTLIKMFGNFDFVLDQFELGVFGLITPKALACGGIVITSYEKEVHDWCFSEHPPLLPADSTESIVEKVLLVVTSADKQTLREASRSWFIKHHSKEVVKECLLECAEKAKENFALKNNVSNHTYLTVPA